MGHKLTKKLLIGLAAIALVVLALAISYRLAKKEAASPKELVLYGNVDIREVDLAFDASGRVRRMLANEGDRVEKGDLLAVLDKERLQENVDRAEAQLAKEKATLEKFETGTRPEEIRRARAQVKAASAEAENAERTYRRLRELAAKGVVARQQVDDAEAAWLTAKAQQNAAEETLKLALAGPRQEEIREARANLDAARAQLALRKTELADASLCAPARGIIRNRVMEPGDMASPQVPAYTLALTDPVWVRAYLPEPDLGRVRPGMKAFVSTDTYPGKSYTGWIGYISPTAEFTPKSVETPELRTQLVYQIRVHVRNPQGELRLGMPATVHIPFAQNKSRRTGINE